MKLDKNTKSRLLTANDVQDVLDGFASDKDRLRYMRTAYKNLSIEESFSAYYGVELSTGDSALVDEFVNVEVGECYSATVSEITKNGITFLMPGIKEEIISKENFNDCMDAVQNYLLTHNNKLYFEVREHVKGKFVVSVINGYYKLWAKYINEAIEKEQIIDVHINSLTNGGYLCQTPITPLNELTGKNYISSVFIPGSNIVLNIERDFERWVGQDVKIIPQKLIEFRKDNRTGISENSLIGSRKQVLQIEGTKNLYDMYQAHQLAMKSDKFVPTTYKGTVTGMINSNKKNGIFVELDDLYITGLLPLDSSELVNYKPGTKVDVYVKEFEVLPHKEPFIVKKGKVYRSNTRCVFDFA